MRVGDAAARWCEVSALKHHFGYTGGAVWPFVDASTPCSRSDAIHADPETHAVPAPDPYCRVSGETAFAIVNEGLGLLDAVGAAARDRIIRVKSRRSDRARFGIADASS